MTSNSALGDDDAGYIAKAIEVALAEIHEAGEQRDLGEVVDWAQRTDEGGTYLRIDFASKRHDRRLVRYERAILSSRGPDKDVETVGMIFGSAFEERLLTRAVRSTVDADGNRYLTFE